MNGEWKQPRVRCRSNESAKNSRTAFASPGPRSPGGAAPRTDLANQHPARGITTPSLVQAGRSTCLTFPGGGSTALLPVATVSAPAPISKRVAHESRRLTVRPMRSSSPRGLSPFLTLFSVSYLRRSGFVGDGKSIAFVVTESGGAPVGASKRRSSDEGQNRQGSRRCHDSRGADRRVSLAKHGGVGGYRQQLPYTGTRGYRQQLPCPRARLRWRAVASGFEYDAQGRRQLAAQLQGNPGGPSALETIHHYPLKFSPTEAPRP